MILRKPYAIFIKLFRPMHFIIAVLLGIISYKYYDIYLFFKTYVKTGHFSYVEDITTFYVNGFLYLCIIALIILFSLIIVLFMYKKKSIISYVILLCEQLFCLFFSFSVKSNLIALDTANIDVRMAIVLRDIAVLLSVINVFLLIWMTLRALGFNLKQFEFGKDLKELQIESTDNEEFEFAVDIDKNDIKTRWNRFKRMSHYYFEEYRRVIITIVLCIALIISLVFATSYFSKEVIYNEKVVVDLDNYKYKFKVIDSHLVETDYKGNVIDQGKNKYVVIRYELTNKTKEEFVFDLTTAVLNGSKAYANVMTLYDSFKDIGVGYIGQKLLPDVTGEFIMVYPIDVKDNSSSFVLKLFNGKDRFSVQINPKKYDKVHTNNTVSLNEELVISNSILPKVNFKISEYKTDSKIIFKDKGIDYAIASNSKENTILWLNYSYQMEDSNIYKFTGKQFVGSYVKVVITKNGKTKTYGVVDKTPKSVSGIATLEVNKEVVDADTIMLKINIRNEEYYYYLKK